MSRNDRLRDLLLQIEAAVREALALLPEVAVVEGRMSIFGGPDDMGVSPSEGLALCEPDEVDEFDEELFLPEQPEGTTGLARRLNPDYPYIAMRWDYEVTSRDWLQQNTVTVINPETGATVYEVQPIDWGPHEDTGRIADLSPGLAEGLGLTTDDICVVRVLIPPQTV